MSCWAVFVCISFPSRGDRETKSRPFPVCAPGKEAAPGGFDTHSNLPGYHHMQKQPPQRGGCFAWSCWAVFVCISFPSRGIGKRNQGLSQCAHRERKPPPAASIHIRICPDTPYAKKQPPQRGGCFAWSCWADSFAFRFPSRGIGKRNQGLSQCAHRERKPPPAASIHIRIYPDTPYAKNSHPSGVAVLHGAAGQIRTADLILTKDVEKPVIL